MDKFGLAILLFINVLSFGLGRELEKTYEIMRDYGPNAEDWFEGSHRVVRRAASTNFSTPTSGPTTQPGTNSTTMSSVTHSNQTTVKMMSTTPGPNSTTVSSDTHSNQRTVKMMSTTPGPNITTNISINEDNHKYYKSRFYESGDKWWFDLESGGTPKFHKNSLYSDTVKTSFQFPYYGHVINKVTITNKGFLFVGEQVHKFNASAQYIAPLMADFAADLHGATSIRYVDTGNRFTVEWTNIKLRHQSVGEFSFQCSILEDGRIVFAYKKVPIPVSEIKNNTFFVRVGLSDSFNLRYILYGLFRIDGRFYTRVRYIVYYRYHHIKLDRSNVKSGTAFVIKPLPNCVLFKTCNSCVQSKTEFECKWCPKLKRCSDGVDRKRHDWLLAGCGRNSVSTCPTDMGKGGGKKAGGNDKQGGNKKKSDSAKTAGTVILVIVCISIVIAVVAWIVYGYRNPQSRSGMFLMQYGNPRKWFRNSRITGESTGTSVTFKSMNLESNA